MTDAENVLRELLNNIFPGRDHVEINAITSGGANYTSALFNVNVGHLKLFAKVAIVGEKLREGMNADWLFRTERRVYSHLSKIYDGLQVNNSMPDEHRFVFPKFYGCNLHQGEETVVLEDLVAAGYNVYNRMKSVDWEHAASAIENLAKFHALSFAYQKNYPEEFEAVMADMQYPFLIQEKVEDSMKATWNKMASAAVEVVKQEHKEKLMKFLTIDLLNEDFEKFRRPLSAPVLVHGDYRLSNLMFRKQNDVTQTIVVDYQTVHVASAAADLLYFVFTGTDNQFREKYYEKLLNHYHEHLVLALGRLNVDANDIYPRETFDSELHQMLPYALMMCVAILPIVTVEEDQAPQVAGANAEIEQFALKPNRLFAERFSGIVDDCVRWGVI